MTKITDFRLKMRTVFPQLNRTGRAYDVIGHQKICLIPYLILLMTIKQIRFKTRPTLDYLVYKKIYSSIELSRPNFRSDKY